MVVPPRRAGDHPLWLLPWLGLIALQGWLTLGLFGPDRPLERLLDDRPVLSGRHALHLYHGALGARSLRQRGTLSCFDPAFHAGYPKTPVFDSGSRPAELALAITGGAYRPAAYKVLLALACAAAPWLFFVAARGVGLPRAAACLACALGMAVWWGRPCREGIEAGEVDLLLATLLALAQAGFLIRYHRAPCLVGLFGVVITGLLGWFAHPLLMALLLPLFLVYYVTVGARHGWVWNVALLTGLLGAVGANAFWLTDWVDYWWIRVPLRVEVPLLAHRTFHTLWDASLWGGPIDRALACVLEIAGVVGVLSYNRCGQRPAARLLGFGSAGFLALAVAGAAWEPLGRLGTTRLLTPALLFAAFPAAHGFLQVVCGLRQRLGVTLMSLAVVGNLAGVAWVARGPLDAWAARLVWPRPLEVGLSRERLELVERLREQTTPEARILWEDRDGGRLASHWTALLPLLTGRAFVGGLDPEAGIEHTVMGLAEGRLAGQPLAEWSDAELRDYCERYNIGWVVCWSDRAVERFARWAEQGYAEASGVLRDEGSACLFTLNRPHSFALVGSAQLLHADAQHILLGNVTPRDGIVVLSLHYHTGLYVAPGRVELQRELDSRDPIPLLRLRLAEPAPLVTISWEKRY
jgi:hypothetical protein